VRYAAAVTTIRATAPRLEVLRPTSQREVASSSLSSASSSSGDALEAQAAAALTHGSQQRKDALSTSTSLASTASSSSLLALRVQTTAPLLPVTRVANLRAAELLPALKAHLESVGFTGDKVLLRFVDLARLPTLQRTGNDRDASSTLYDVPDADCSAVDRRAHQVARRQVTYAHTVVGLNDGAPCIQVGESLVSLAAHLDAAAAFDTGSAIVLYDPARVMPNESLVEVWLPKQSQRAVLGIFSTRG